MEPAAEGIDGEPESVLALAQQRGFGRCPVCWVLTIEDAVLTECGHRYCPACLATLSGADFAYKCPTCRTTCLTIKTMRCRTLYREVQQFSCPGCHEADLTLTAFNEHVRRACPARAIQCTKCQEIVPAPLFRAHVAREHPVVDCEACGESVGGLSPHLCPEENVPCVCGEVPSRKQAAAHRDACPLRPASCRLCGVAGPQVQVQVHETTCTLETCPFCRAVCTAVKRAAHQCTARPVACPVEECLFVGGYLDLEPHVTSTHTALFDTGVFSRTSDCLYVLRDALEQYRIVQKVAEDEVTVTVNYFGWGDKWTETVPKNSPRLWLLSEKMDADFSTTVLYRLFQDDTPGSLRSSFEAGELSHRDAELICEIERRYKRRPPSPVFSFSGNFSFSNPS